MSELAESLLLLALLLGSRFIGMFFQRWLREYHRSHDTVDAARMVIVILVTFAALVLSLLMNSVKSNFDVESEAERNLGGRLIELDSRLREYGPEAEPIRAIVRQYTAATIVVRWPDEPAPKGDYTKSPKSRLRGGLN